MRNFTSNPARIIIKDAVKAARGDKSTFNRQMTGNATPTSGTTYSTDGETGVVTTHPPFYVGIDDVGGNAILTE